MLDLAEATARWARVRRMMEERNLDVLVAIDVSRDEILRGHQRWLTGYIPIGGPAAAVLGHDGPIELVSDRIGKPVSDYYNIHAFPVEPVSGYSCALVEERIVRRRPRRIGIAETETFPAALAATLRESAVELVDVSEDMQLLRLRKSAYELALIQKSCEIADAVWERMPEIFQIGRRNYEVIADIDHLVRLQGAEGGFHLVLPLPFLGRSMRSLANPDRIQANARYLVEVSPRYGGYYSQLTIPVTSYADDELALRAYQDLVQAKQAAQPIMRPGVNLSDVADFIAGFLAKRGRAMTSRSLGHFCGMALEEPRHDPARPFVLAEGMTLIFHPILAEPDLRSLMRADTYHITGSGAERMNRFGGDMLAISQRA